jgi:hypothetical protein
MSIATILRVFRNSCIITERGEFKIGRVFVNAKEAAKARYYYYRTENGIAIYARQGRAGKLLFAVAGK